MVAPISSLANMEMALYGGFGSNVKAPSFLNGYGATNIDFSMNMYPLAYGQGYNNIDSTTFRQNIPYGYGAMGNQQTAQSKSQSESVFQGLAPAETRALVNDYKQSLVMHESLLGCAASNALFGITMHPRLIAHPINSITTLGKVNKAFADVKVEGSALNKLWVGAGANAAEAAAQNSNILREAYFQMHKAEARCNTKLGAFRRSYKATSDVDRIQKVIKDLESALKRGDMKAITENTAMLKHAYSSNGGFVNRGWNGLKRGLGKIVPESWSFNGVSIKDSLSKEPMTVADKLNDKNGIKNVVAELNKSKSTSFKDILARGGGVKGGLFFMAMDYLMSFGKIKTAFEADSETGWKQLGQTTARGVSNAVGWTLGEAASTWAFAKWGAKLGSKVHPLFGTLIGGIVGMIGGGIGMWLTGKGTTAIVGQDVADEITAKKLAQTPDGQVQLLQTTIERMQAGEKVAPEAQQAVQKIITNFS